MNTSPPVVEHDSPEAEERRAIGEEAASSEQFLATLAHELRQPLTVVMLAGGGLAEARTPQDVRERLGALIVRAAGRMDRIVVELLDSRHIANLMPATLAAAISPPETPTPGEPPCSKRS